MIRAPAYLPGMEQFRNITLGPRYAVRLEDIKDGHCFRGRCLACAHEKIVTPDTLRGSFPEYTRIIEIEKKLKCEACGNGTGNILTVGQLISS